MIMLISIDIGVGLSSVVLSMMYAMEKQKIRFGFFKPVTDCNLSEVDFFYTSDSISYFIKHYYPQVSYACSLDINYVEYLFDSNKLNILMEEIAFRFYQTFSKESVVLIEGVMSSFQNPYFFKLNLDIAKLLNAEIIFVSSLDKSYFNLKKCIKLVDIYFDSCKKNVIGIIFNKIDAPKYEYKYVFSNIFKNLNYFPFLMKLENRFSCLFKDIPFPILGCIPWNINLLSTRVVDVISHINAHVIYEGEIYIRRIKEIVICSNNLFCVLKYCNSESLLIISLNFYEALVAIYFILINRIEVSSILLTDFNEDKKLYINQHFQTLLNKCNISFFFVKSNIVEVLLDLRNFNLKVFVNDRVRIRRIQKFFVDYIDYSWLRIRKAKSLKKSFFVSSSFFCYRLIELACQHKKRIVFPEGNDSRIIRASSVCSERGIASCILLGNADIIKRIAFTEGITLHRNIQIINPLAFIEKYVSRLVELRKNKGMNEFMARKQLSNNVVFGTLMLESGDVDGLVSGVVNTTADTIRPALQIIKMVPGVSLVSSIFFMLFSDQVLIYGDCAINPNPTAEQLSEIALQSANSAITFGIEPRVAMISYATGNSGFGKDVDKVRKATLLAKKKCPSLIIDGPLQYDAAISQDVARIKAPFSSVAGNANVFIFPDLNTGNVTYKAVQRSANLISIGPILQGICKPVNDLSRGALLEDIIYTVAITSIQS
ncbi:phosphate acetyltransferase [Candidatus Westeberhardia cardiocondylae]|uniref:phosphate acetyltransferase n=1 Tax=Candidatus Westeberhardia cardiocondylae TaxID=1594731 RepID=UPI003B969BB3